MPELPEVETVCEGLRQSILGDTLIEVELRRPDIRFPIPPDLPAHAKGKRIQEIERRAKYIQLFLEGGEVLLVHLGMSGRMLVLPALPNQWAAHDHVIFKLSSGKVIVFNDPRRFGIVTIAREDALATHPLLSHLGPEPLDGDKFNESYLFQQLKKRKGPIKPVIMDQKLVVGVGNIYASEALYLTGISPIRPSNKITKNQCISLVKSINKVLAAAIQSGGSTLRDYVDSKGKNGYFQHHFRVYGKEGQPCESCGKPILKIVQANRASFYCKNCQK